MRALVGLVTVAAVIAAALGSLTTGRALPASAVLTVIGGDVTVQSVEGARFVSAADGAAIRTGATVRTMEAARAVITFPDGSTTEIEPSTTLSIEELAETSDSVLLVRLAQPSGATWSFVQTLTDPRSRFYVRTPASTELVRGTAFEVVVTDGGNATTVNVTHGRVEVVAAATVLAVPAGHTTTVETGATVGSANELPPPAARARFGVIGAAFMTVTAPNGLSAGQTPLGVVDQIPHAAVTRAQDDPQLVEISDPGAGRWEVALEPWGAGGAFQVVLNSIVGRDVRDRRILSGTIRPGEHLVAQIPIDVANAVGEFGLLRNTTVARAKIAVDHPTNSARAADVPRTTPLLDEIPAAAVRPASDRGSAPLVFVLPPEPPAAAAPPVPEGSSPPSEQPVAITEPPSLTSSPSPSAGPSVPPSTATPAASVSPVAPPTPGPSLPPVAVATTPPPGIPAPTTPTGSGAGPSPTPSPSPTQPPAPPSGSPPAVTLVIRVPQNGHPLTAGVPLNTVTELSEGTLSDPLIITATINGTAVPVERVHLINSTLTVKVLTSPSLPDGNATVRICVTDATAATHCGVLTVVVQHGTGVSGGPSGSGAPATPTPRPATTTAPPPASSAPQPGSPPPSGPGKGRKKRSRPPA